MWFFVEHTIPAGCRLFYLCRSALRGYPRRAAPCLTCCFSDLNLGRKPYLHYGENNGQDFRDLCTFRCCPDWMYVPCLRHVKHDVSHIYLFMHLLVRRTGTDSRKPEGPFSGRFTLRLSSDLPAFRSSPLPSRLRAWGSGGRARPARRSVSEPDWPAGRSPAAARGSRDGSPRRGGCGDATPGTGGGLGRSPFRYRSTWLRIGWRFGSDRKVEVNSRPLLQPCFPGVG